jgi:hypothetical protein
MKFWSGIAVVLLSGFVVAQSVVGSFRYVKETDPLNDEDRSYIWTQETRDGQRAGKLQFRCQQNNQTQKTDLFVALEHHLRLPEYYGQYARVRLQYRLDSQPASSNWLSYFSEDQTRVYIADEARKALVNDARKAQKMTVVVTGDELAPQTYTFNLEEFALAVGKLKCRVQN